MTKGAGGYGLKDSGRFPLFTRKEKYLIMAIVCIVIAWAAATLMDLEYLPLECLK